MATKRQPGLEPLEEAIDHVRGPSGGRLIVEYGDYECPYSRRAFREIERVEQRLSGGVRFAFRHFPLTEIHTHASAAAAGTPTLFIDGVVCLGAYDAATLMVALSG